jgi:hypothetical protein
MHPVMAAVNHPQSLIGNRGPPMHLSLSHRNVLAAPGSGMLSPNPPWRKRQRLPLSGNHVARCKLVAAARRCDAGAIDTFLPEKREYLTNPWHAPTHHVSYGPRRSPPGFLNSV